MVRLRRTHTRSGFVRPVGLKDLRYLRCTLRGGMPALLFALKEIPLALSFGVVGLPVAKKP